MIEIIDVNSGSVTGSGTSNITINPTQDLASGADFYINIDSTAFNDLAGNHFLGISNNTTWNFKTVVSNNITSSSSSGGTVTTPTGNPGGGTPAGNPGGGAPGGNPGSGKPGGNTGGGKLNPAEIAAIANNNIENVEAGKPLVNPTGNDFGGKPAGGNVSENPASGDTSGKPTGGNPGNKNGGNPSGNNAGGNTSSNNSSGSSSGNTGDNTAPSITPQVTITGPTTIKLPSNRAKLKVSHTKVKNKIKCSVIQTGDMKILIGPKNLLFTPKINEKNINLLIPSKDVVKIRKDKKERNIQIKVLCDDGEGNLNIKITP